MCNKFSAGLGWFEPHDFSWGKNPWNWGFSGSLAGRATQPGQEGEGKSILWPDTLGCPVLAGQNRVGSMLAGLGTSPLLEGEDDLSPSALQDSMG